uniref:C2H2-type domain-containing protein n=1 Tax=Solanum lycopersicum TaxID=4081 RepID=A0A3Q7FML9_SOLLC
MQEQTELHGIWKFQCITCNKLFSSSQAIAGHTRIHFKEGRVKGTHQKKVFVPFPNSQQPESSTTIDLSSTHHQQQIFSTNISDNDSPNSHQLGLSPVPTSPKKDLRLRDMKTLARLRGRLTKEEDKVVMLLLDMAKK